MDDRKRLLLARLAALSAACLGVVYLWVSFGSLRGLARAVDHAPRAFVDFVFVYYPAGKAVVEGGEVVQGFFYSPFFAFLMAPVSGLPGSTPLYAWIVLQLCFAIALGVAGLLLVRERPPWLTVAYAALVPLSFPIVHGFSWGQVSAGLIALALWGLWFVEREKPALGGTLLGLAAAIKYYPVVLAFGWLMGRRWRALVALGVVLLVALALLPGVFLGVEGGLAFYDDVAAMIEANRDLLVEDVNSQYFPHVLKRWSGRDPDASAVLGTTASLVVWSSLGLMLALSALTGRVAPTRPLAWSFVLLMLATPFWVPTSWPHYFVYLPFAQLFLAGETLAGRERSGALRVVMGALVAVSALVSSVPFFQVVGGKAVYGASGALFVANALLLVASVMWLAPRLQKAPLVEAEKL